MILLLVKSTWAQQVSLTLSPGITTITTKPGRTIYQKLQLVNSGDPQVYTLRLYQLSPADTQGNYSLAPVTDSRVKVLVTAPYIHLSTPFFMQSNTHEDLPLRIEIPESTEASPVDGEYRFALVAEAEKPLPVQGNINTRISPGLASILDIRVLSTNTDVKNIETVLFSVVTPLSLHLGNVHIAMLDSGEPIPYIYQLKNRGAMSVTPEGTLTVTNLMSKEQESYHFLPVKMYPEQDRLIPVAGYDTQTCAKQFSEKKCSPTYSYVHSGYKVGLFEASTKTTFGGDSPVLYSSTFFIVVPFLLVWFVAISIIVILLLLGYHWKKHLQEAKKPSSHRRGILH